jgi:hypothetical protein
MTPRRDYLEVSLRGRVLLGRIIGRAGERVNGVG